MLSQRFESFPMDLVNRVITSAIYLCDPGVAVDRAWIGQAARTSIITHTAATRMLYRVIYIQLFTVARLLCRTQEARPFIVEHVKGITIAPTLIESSLADFAAIRRVVSICRAAFVQDPPGCFNFFESAKPSHFQQAVHPSLRTHISLNYVSRRGAAHSPDIFGATHLHFCGDSLFVAMRVRAFTVMCESGMIPAVTHIAIDWDPDAGYSALFEMLDSFLRDIPSTVRRVVLRIPPIHQRKWDSTTVKTLDNNLGQVAQLHFIPQGAGEADRSSISVQDSFANVFRHSIGTMFDDERLHLQVVQFTWAEQRLKMATLAREGWNRHMDGVEDLWMG